VKGPRRTGPTVVQGPYSGFSHGLVSLGGQYIRERWRLMHVGKLSLVAAIAGVSSLALVVHLSARQGVRVSPHESTSAMVDGSTLTITYGRPSMRGRTVFGRLVPYGRVWCPGADEATTLDSTRALRLGELTVPPGPHTIWIRPTQDAWTLIVSKEPSGFHTNYNASADLGSVEMAKRALDAPVEQLTFSIAKNPTGGGGRVVLTWETTEASVPFAIQ
jgi:DUF2911 family protein